MLDELRAGGARGFDVEGHLLSVVRSVSSLLRDARGAHAVTLARSYATTVDPLSLTSLVVGAVSTLRVGSKLLFQDAVYPPAVSP